MGPILGRSPRRVLQLVPSSGAWSRLAGVPWAPPGWIWRPLRRSSGADSTRVGDRALSAPRDGEKGQVPGTSLRLLRWLTVLGPLMFFVALDRVRHALDPTLLLGWAGLALTSLIVLVAALAFSETVFGLVERMQARLFQQNRELLSLHEAGLAITAELGLEAVLQKVVDGARALAGARYGALSIPAADGTIETFLTSGITEAQRAAIGPFPREHAVLGVVLREGQHLRLHDVTRDPRAVGFPPDHPAMRSLLAVPIASRGRILGNLYLAEKQGAREFSSSDEETLVRFATQAAVAIENARLHRQVRDLAIVEERERIAREMHDSLAQVLGYVNTKAEAVQELLRSGQPDRAQAHVAQLGEAARSAYADVREGILGLRTSLGADRSLLDALREYVERWQEQSAIRAELKVEGDAVGLADLSPFAELQLLRIVQEALANIRKHARAASARVTLRATPAAIEAVVSDDGRGFDPVATSGRGIPRFGLATMRERAEAIGGALTVETAPAAGTRVTIRLPRHGVP